jgi:hypothetical protein
MYVYYSRWLFCRLATKGVEIDESLAGNGFQIEIGRGSRMDEATIGEAKPPSVTHLIFKKRNNS